MKSQLKKIRSMAESLHLLKGLCDDEHLFTPALANLFYFNGNIGENDLSIDFVDGSNDGGIDFLFSKQETLFFLQGKSSSDLSADDVFDAFRKMKDSVEHLEKREFSGFNKKLISKILSLLILRSSRLKMSIPDLIYLYTIRSLSMQNLSTNQQEAS